MSFVSVYRLLVFPKHYRFLTFVVSSALNVCEGEEAERMRLARFYWLIALQSQLPGLKLQRKMLFSFLPS